ncbi:MAG: lipid A-modifier LpxR family protein [Chitinophagaceae bacterium]
MYKLKFLLPFCLMILQELHSQDSLSDSKYIGIRFYVENDIFSFLATNYDDNYTGGVKIEIFSNFSNAFFTKRILNPLKWDPIQQYISFNVVAFTPFDLGNKDIVRDERPYASYQHFSFGTSFWAQDRKKKASYEILLGKIGKHLAGNVQEKAHRCHWLGITRPEPFGWKYQIAEGGAFAANVRFNYQQILAGKPISKNKSSFVAVWRNDLNFGNYVSNVSTGIRLLFITGKTSVLNEGEPEIVVPNIREKNKVQAYVYITPKVKLVMHNATLTGKHLNRSSVHTIDPDDISRLLTEYDAGVQVSYGILRAGYILMGRGKEYALEKKYYHHWGGIHLGLVKQFQ